MGLVLIIFSSLSGLVNLIALFIWMNAINKLSQFYSETNAVMPFWTKNAWILLTFFLIIDVVTIFFGRFITKHNELNKKYLYLSIILLILVIFAIPLGFRYLFLPLLMSVYNSANIL